MIKRKSQISIVEFSFVAMLMVIVIGYFSFPYFINSNDYKFSIDSLADTIYETNEFRTLIIDEDLIFVGFSEDWSDLENLLDNVFGSDCYDFEVSNISHVKKIFACNETTTKILTQRIVSIKDNENFDFRQFRLGVCY